MSQCGGLGRGIDAAGRVQQFLAQPRGRDTAAAIGGKWISAGPALLACRNDLLLRGEVKMAFHVAAMR